MPQLIGLSSFAGFGDFDPVLIAPDQSNRVTALLQAMAEHPMSAKLFDTAQDMAAHDDYWPQADSWMAQFKPYVVKNGVLQIPVKGMLLHNFPYSFGSYATGYYYIQKALERGIDDAEVKGIAFVCDTPGGHVAGCFELCDKIYDARAKKPLAAFAHESAYSAGYAIFSSAARGTASRTGGVGSIGVVTMHMDWSKALAEAGLKVTFIFAGKHKVDGNAYEPLGADVKARIQARIDESYGEFCALVARNRGIEESAVRKTEALTFGATEALKVKLIDAIGPLDEAMAEFQAGLDAPKEEDDNMTAVTKEAHEAAVAEAQAGGAKSGATSERQRIAAIKSCDEAKTRPVAAESLAMNTDLSVEDARKALAAMAEEKPVAAATEPTKTNGKDGSFAKAMERVGSEAAGAGAGSESQTLTQEQEEDAAAERILDARYGKGSTAALRANK